MRSSSQANPANQPNYMSGTPFVQVSCCSTCGVVLSIGLSAGIVRKVRQMTQIYVYRDFQRHRKFNYGRMARITSEQKHRMIFSFYFWRDMNVPWLPFIKDVGDLDASKQKRWSLVSCRSTYGARPFEIWHDKIAFNWAWCWDCV